MDQLNPTAGGLPVVEYGFPLGTSFRMLRQPDAERTVAKARVKQPPAIARLSRSIDMNSSFLGDSKTLRASSQNSVTMTNGGNERLAAYRQSMSGRKKQNVSCCANGGETGDRLRQDAKSDPVRAPVS